MPSHFRNQLLVSRDDSRLWPAKQLVSAAQHQRKASFDALPHCRLAHTRSRKINQAARAEVFTTGNPRRSPSAISSATSGFSVKPLTVKFEGCTRNNSRVLSLIA